MKRGEIYYAELDPTIGAETQKKRPVIIVSNNANNQMSETITIVPITSNVKKTYLFEVYLDMQDSGLPKNSKAQCQQIRTISKLRVKSPVIGMLNAIIMERIHAALKLHLKL